MLYDWREASELPQGLAGSILYFPALALFLVLRVILDHWSSMFEVLKMQPSLDFEIGLHF